MPPSIKDSDTLTGTRETTRSGSATGSSGDSAVKQQPVALEIPISVNGARTVEGSDKREPFSETTKTVMVFGSGAVIRLASNLAPGQLLFLTNERTKKEVVCQVVKSKNYRNVSGYVELEFTEPAVGFWGMRFHSDRISAGPQAAPEAAGNGSPGPARPAAQKMEPPAANGGSSSTTAVGKLPSPASVSSRPTSPAAPGSSIVPPPLDSATLLGAPKSKRDSGVPTAPAPVATSLGSDAPLIEPWLKKREPASRIPSARPATAPPEAAAKSEEAETSLPRGPNFALSHPSDQPASIFAPAEAPLNPAKVGLSSLTPFFEVKPGPTDAGPAPPPPQAPATSDPETEDLKQHTARLQEELSKMKFAEPVASSPAKAEVETPSFPLSEQAISAIKTELVHDSAVRLVENSEASNAAPPLPKLPALEEPSNDAPPAPIAALETLQQEEMKIPAWLEPLASNASAPSSTQEPVLRKKAKRRAGQPTLEQMTAPLVAPAEEKQVAGSRAPQFGSALPFEEVKSGKESTPKKSGKGMLLGAIAAGILILAGGAWWYMNQQSAGVHASVPAMQAPAASTASQDSLSNSTKEAALGSTLSTHGDTVASEGKPAAANSNTPLKPVNNISSSAPAGPTAAAARKPQAAANSLNGGSDATRAASAGPERESAAEKKPALGEVHLAAPKISQKKMVQTTAEPDAGISLSEDQPEANADSLSAGLGIANNQPAAPAAPVAVGGDVKQAKLISSVPPAYPAMAKAQHISGGVTVDALIDESGRVTKMKVMSGPTLLQQAAMDALRQWRYQPATLDGKAVSMHLIVTIQFRLQ